MTPRPRIPRIPWIGWPALCVHVFGNYDPDRDPNHDEPCRCGARVGGLHNSVNGRYCDLEWCSCCGEQALSCHCDAEEEELELHLLVPENDQQRETFGAVAVTIAPKGISVEALMQSGFPMVALDPPEISGFVDQLTGVMMLVNLKRGSAVEPKIWATWCVCCWLCGRTP